MSVQSSVLCNTVRYLYRDAKAHCSAKSLTEEIANLGVLRSVKCNASGSQVSILISQVNGRRTALTLYILKSCSADTKIYNWSHKYFLLIFSILKWDHFV